MFGGVLISLQKNRGDEDEIVASADRRANSRLARTLERQTNEGKAPTDVMHVDRTSIAAHQFGGSQNRSHFLNYKSAQTGQVCVALLKIVSARHCDEQEQPAVRVKGSDIQKRESA